MHTLSYIGRCSSTLRRVPVPLVEQIGFTEGIDKAKGLLILSMRLSRFESEKIPYADSRILFVGN